MMEKVNSSDIEETLKIIETYLNFEIKDLQKKTNNLKKINIKAFTDRIRSELEIGVKYDIESLIYRINQITSD